MLQFAHPPGVPSRDPIGRERFNGLRDANVLSQVPQDEREAIIGSAGKTYVRAGYHEYRFFELRQQLDQRRVNMPGSVFWDSLVEYVHFELQAFAGAARMLLDELVYIIARHNGVDAKAARWKWETAALFDATKRRPAQEVPEVLLLLLHEQWFETLNAFRNKFYHHGWTHGSGHYSEDDIRSIAAMPDRNGLLVPDLHSLKARNKPHEWTWSKRTTVDDIAVEIRAGLDAVLDQLFDHWKLGEVAPARNPRSEHPNMFAMLIKPVLMQVHGEYVIPLFTTPQLARACEPMASDPELELAYAPVCDRIVGEPAISISLAGLDMSSVGGRWIEVLLDPQTDASWTTIHARFQARVDVAELRKHGTHVPLSLPIAGVEAQASGALPPGCDRLWVWRRNA